MSLTHTLRSITVGMPHILLGGVPSVRAGEELLAYRLLEDGAVVTPLRISSDAFDPGGPIPARCSAEGGNQSPSIRWSGVPDIAQSLVLIVEDPDAPTPHPFVHWIVYNIDPRLTELPEGFSGAME